MGKPVVMAYHANLPGNFSFDYVHNPYLEDLGIEE